MVKDQLIGIAILLASLAGLGIYFWILFFSVWSILLLQITAFIAMALILGIAAWIGWVMATTPPPKPIEEIATESKSEGTE